MGVLYPKCSDRAEVLNDRKAVGGQEQRQSWGKGRDRFGSAAPRVTPRDLPGPFALTEVRCHRSCVRDNSSRPARGLRRA